MFAKRFQDESHLRRTKYYYLINWNAIFFHPALEILFKRLYRKKKQPSKGEISIHSSY